MKNKYLIYIFFYLIFPNLGAENLNIEASKISLDKINQTTVFENNVKIITDNGNQIVSDYATYNKKLNFIVIKDNITATDLKNNIIKTNYAEYDESKKIFKTKGYTKIITPENYTIISNDIVFDNSKKFINSDKKTSLSDENGNQINLENFEYNIEDNIFKSIGVTEVKDINENVYEFSQIYIDTKKRNIRH